MKKELTIAFMICATPFLISKLIDVHLPSSEEMYMEKEKERTHENNRAFDILNDSNATDKDRERAYNTLLDNGAMA